MLCSDCSQPHGNQCCSWGQWGAVTAMGVSNCKPQVISACPSVGFKLGGGRKGCSHGGEGIHGGQCSPVLERCSHILRAAYDVPLGCTWGCPGVTPPDTESPPAAGCGTASLGRGSSRRFAAGLALLPRPGFAHESRRSTRPRPQLPPAPDPQRGHQRRPPQDGSGRRGEAAAAGRGHGQVRGCTGGAGDLREPLSSRGSRMGSAKAICSGRGAGEGDM